MSPLHFFQFQAWSLSKKHHSTSPHQLPQELEAKPKWHFPQKLIPSENAPSNEEKTETAGSSSSSVNPAQNAVPKVIVEHVLDLPKMWTNNN